MLLQLLAHHCCLIMAKTEQASDWLTIMEPNEFFHLPEPRNLLPGRWQARGDSRYAVFCNSPRFVGQPANQKPLKWRCFLLFHGTQENPGRDSLSVGTGHC